MDESLEHHEHAEHAAHAGRRSTALLIAVLAAGLALAEQGAHHAETRLQASAVAAADSWAEYQAKSIRAANARSLAEIASSLTGAGEVASRLRADADHYDNDPESGKQALAKKARGFEEQRDRAHERLEAFDNGSAAFQLGIVLATASVITGAAWLALAGLLLGAGGAVCAVLAMIAPGLVAF